MEAALWVELPKMLPRMSIYPACKCRKSSVRDCAHWQQCLMQPFTLLSLVCSAPPVLQERCTQLETDLPFNELSSRSFFILSLERAGEEGEKFSCLHWSKEMAQVQALGTWMSSGRQDLVVLYNDPVVCFLPPQYLTLDCTSHSKTLINPLYTIIRLLRSFWQTMLTFPFSAFIVIFQYTSL